MNDYIITEIEPKNGEMREIHKMMLNCECNIINLRLHHSAWFRYYPNNTTKEKIAYTSVVEKIEYIETGDIIIHTKNTVYLLKEIRHHANQETKL